MLVILDPPGGIVFYDHGDYSLGWRYIEAAPYDLGGSEWGCYNSSIIEARKIGIGFGLENSTKIVEHHDSFTDYYNNPSVCSNISNGTVAAKACLELDIEGFNNWHLPSEGEVQLLYENLHLNELGNFDEEKLYWSSTEHNNNTATTMNFSNGDRGWLCKQCDYGQPTIIRAVRYF